MCTDVSEPEKQTKKPKHPGEMLHYFRNEKLMLVQIQNRGYNSETREKRSSLHSIALTQSHGSWIAIFTRQAADITNLKIQFHLPKHLHDFTSFESKNIYGCSYTCKLSLIRSQYHFSCLIKSKESLKLAQIYFVSKLTTLNLYMSKVSLTIIF